MSPITLAVPLIAKENPVEILTAVAELVEIVQLAKNVAGSLILVARLIAQLIHVGQITVVAIHAGHAQTIKFAILIQVLVALQIATEKIAGQTVVAEFVAPVCHLTFATQVDSA